ncbi:MAG: putative baseplate assembly protein, partial [Spirochaetales bacterium]|nr:putative baseplate assembly protein [Spirochaetales bacterium]
VNDYTDSFHESGFVEFTVPSKQYSKKEFGKELYWIRARLLSGSFESRPKILSITLNSVYARNVTTYKGEILGSGTGAPGQYFLPAHNPILPGCILSVNEGSIPPANELESMKSDGIIDPYIAEGDSIWVRYKEVDNFYSSGPFSRHYVVDYQEGKIYFGDGQRGVNPPRIKFNIRLDSYSVGGGSAGNVAAHTLKILTKSIPFISGCNNPFPAEGGADMESVENLKSRAAGAFKSLQRAVTVEDFEWLARESSSSVGRAYCLKNKNLRGEITVIVIPVMFPGSSFTDRLFPSRELLRRVKEYLEDRKLVGTKISVQGPLYRTFDLTVTLVIKSDVLDSERLKKEIESSLRGHFHPLVGNQGSGWEFGKIITSGAVFKQLERIEGILSVDAVEIFDVDAGVSVEKVVLKDDEIPFLREVLLENRKEQA